MKPLVNKKSFVAIFILILTVACVNTSSHKPAPSPSAVKPVYLDQGWDRTNKFRELSYYTSQGSRLIPYQWFLALEQADNENLFRDPAHIASLGFLNYRPTAGEDLDTYEHLNPDGLPVGFVKDPPFKKGENGADKDGWMGFNCSACHTGQVHYKGTALRIDGGPSLADLQTFLEKMRSAIKATLKDSAKFDRFAGRVNPADPSALRKELEDFDRTFSAMEDRNYSPLRYGFARLDAFGAILNAVAHNLDKTAKLPSPNAPVSYPFIWDAPHLDWVQWNAAVDNPIARNAGEVVGVYGQIKPDPKTLFTSSTRMEELFLLEEWVKVLKSPKWPENHLTKIDRHKAALGRTIYINGGRKEKDKPASHKGCVGCHTLPDSPNRMTDPLANFAGKSFIRTEVAGAVGVPGKDKLGTDPRMATNFRNSQVVVGPLAGFLTKSLNIDPPLKPEDKYPAVEVLKAFVKVMIAPHMLKLSPQQFKEYTGYRTLPLECRQPGRPGYCDIEPPEPPTAVRYELLAYKARPLNGIWATAPYLHNGSVPNLRQLLVPAERVETFCVGSREFDPVNVGFAYDASQGCEGQFKFDTALEGNRNTGHDFAKHLDPDELDDLLEFLKTL